MSFTPSDYQQVKRAPNWHTRINSFIADIYTWVFAQLAGKAASDHTHGAGGTVVGIGTTAGRAAVTDGYIQSETDTLQIELLDASGAVLATTQMEGDPLPLNEQASDPTPVANKGFIYPKDVAGVTEIFYMDSAGAVSQLTSGGAINAVGKSVVRFAFVGDIYDGATLVKILSCVAGTLIGVYAKIDGTSVSADLSFYNGAALIKTVTGVTEAGAATVTGLANTTVAALSDLSITTTNVTGGPTNLRGGFLIQLS